MIMLAWEKIEQTQKDVEFLNMYKGMPVIISAQIVSVNKKTVNALLKPFKSVCLTLSQKTIVLSDILGEAVNAEVLEVDLRAGTATLGNFHYVGGKLGDRMSMRIEPKGEPKAQLVCDGKTIEGTLTDLSLSGAGVLFPPEVAGHIRPRSIVRFIMTLPADALNLPGVARHVSPTAEYARVGVAFAPDAKIRSVFDYVNQRRLELLNDLKVLYEEAMK